MENRQYNVFLLTPRKRIAVMSPMLSCQASRKKVLMSALIAIALLFPPRKNKLMQNRKVMELSEAKDFMG